MRHRPALSSLLAGLVVMAVAQLAAPLGSPPLYDGVVVQEPYQYLAPGPGQAGSPTSFRQSAPVQGAASLQFLATTSESPPQAQLVSPPGAFVFPQGVTTLTASIEPVAAPTSPSDGSIAGNVYRFAVVGQSGAPLAINPGTLPTVVLRAPDGIGEATIARNSGGVWQKLPTQPSGQPGMFITNADALGDFALIAAAAPGPFGPDPRLAVAVVAAALVLVGGLGVLVFRARRQPAPDRAGVQPRRPGSSKRSKGGRRHGGSR